MKHKIKLFFLSSLLFNVAFSQGVPTIDGTQITNTIKQWAKEAEQFKESMELNKKQFESITGVRDITGFMNEASGILNQVDDLSSWLGRSQEILKYGKDILSPDLRKIFDDFQLTNLCEFKVGSDKKICEGEIIIDVVKQKNNEKNLAQLESRIKTIENISTRMAKSKDPKESIDLGNAMSIQLGLLQSDKLKFEIQRNMEESQARLLEKQKQDEIEKQKNNHEAW